MDQGFFVFHLPMETQPLPLKTISPILFLLFWEVLRPSIHARALEMNTMHKYKQNRHRLVNRCLYSNAIFSQRFLELTLSPAGLPYIRCLEPLGTLDDIECNFFTLSQRLESLRRNGREMYEDILAIILLDESKAFRVIEPLHATFSHLPFTTFQLWTSVPASPN
jgi:hypothetical protein